MTDIKKYEPMLSITTYEGKQYCIRKEYEKEFLKQINELRFVKVQGATIASRDIRLIEDAKEKYSMNDVPLEYREVIKARSKKYRESIMKEPSTNTVLKWVEKLKNGEQIG